MTTPVFQSIKLTKPNPSGPLQEQVVDAINASAGAADAGKLVVLNASGVIDSSMVSGGGGSSAFNAITSGTNLTATMTVGTGASLTFTGSGVVNATEVQGIPIAPGTAATTQGKVPISQGDGTAIWADPFVQGVYAPGTRTDTGGVSGGPINPVLVGGSDYTATPSLRNLKIDASGQLYVNIVSGAAGDTQYANGAAVATPTGTVALGWDGANVRALSTSASGQLNIANFPATYPSTADGVVDTNNSTTAALGANAVFTGAATDMLPYTSVRVSIASDKSGSAAIQFSEDGTNWDFVYTQAFTGGNNDVWSFNRRARYFRIVYTNGGTIQTFFRLQTIMQRIMPPISSRPIGIVPDDQDTGVLAQAVIIGHTTAGGGSYVPVKVNPSGTLTVDASGTTVPVSGTFWQATQPVSIAATVNVQDAADMTGTTPGTAPSKTLIIGGIFNSVAPAPTTGQTLPLQLDSAGRLIVNVGAGSSGNAAASATGAAVPASADYIGFNSGGNLVGVSSTNRLPTIAEITDGTNTAAVKAASTAPAAADPALVVSLSPNSAQFATSTTSNTPSQQAVGAASVSILASNTGRKEVVVVNTGTTIIFLGLGQTPTGTAYHIALAACTAANDGTGGTWTSDMWKGAINAIGSGAGGTVVVTELT